MDRYSKITNKNVREIVLLKAFPCAWGKCAFCDYIDDNSKDEQAMVRLNSEVLKNVTGEFGVLEVIDSASCFELPKATLEEIRNIIREKHISKLFLRVIGFTEKNFSRCEIIWGFLLSIKSVLKHLTMISGKMF